MAVRHYPRVGLRRQGCAKHVSRLLLVCQSFEKIAFQSRLALYLHNTGALHFGSARGNKGKAFGRFAGAAVESENSLLGYLISWVPMLIYMIPQLWVTIWLTFKLIRVQQQMVRAQEGILAKLTEIDSRMAGKPAAE